MMPKTLLVFVIFLLLAGCAPAGVATPTAESISTLSVSTPVVGAVTVISMPPGQASLVLIASPEMSVSLGKVKIGDTGKALGIDASGKWMLVEINKQTGWLLIQYLDYTIAQ
jgi:hypothetical protein